MLQHIIEIDENKCHNCHQCIAVCPVKFANNGKDNVIHLNPELCIGCGECIHACSHGARKTVDDFEVMLSTLERKEEKMIAIVAPAIAATFPTTYLHFNGWLKSIGFDAIFDVSFGAELTVKSYIEHIKANNPQTVIAQPCPAIVTYIQIYQPELLPYLAPAHSPMLHIMLAIRKYYPQYAHHKIVAISPCIAKKREFAEVGLGDYNVTLAKIQEHLEQRGIRLADYPEVDFDNDPAERAVLFSSPGGLLATAERDFPGIGQRTRKIEGVNSIYPYLRTLPASIKNGTSPLMVDCLNCEQGCNGGTGTLNSHKSQDEMEFAVSQRKQKLLQRHHAESASATSIEALHQTIDRYWESGAYDRTYANHSRNYSSRISEPTEEQVNDILHTMAKYGADDLKNCASCGYNSCKEMAKAIFNGLNHKGNCHFYLEHRIKEHNQELVSSSEELLDAMEKIRRIIG